MQTPSLPAREPAAAATAGGQRSERHWRRQVPQGTGRRWALIPRGKGRCHRVPSRGAHDLTSAVTAVWEQTTGQVRTDAEGPGQRPCSQPPGYEW